MITEEKAQKNEDQLQQTPSLGIEKGSGNHAVITTDKLVPTSI